MRVIERRVGFKDGSLVALPREFVYRRVNPGVARCAERDEVFRTVVRGSGFLAKTVDVMDHVRRVLSTLLAGMLVPCKNDLSGTAKFVVFVRRLSPPLDLVGVVGVVRSCSSAPLRSLARITKFLDAMLEHVIAPARSAFLDSPNRNNTTRQAKRLEASDVVLFVRDRLAGFAVGLSSSARGIFDSAAGAILRQKPNSSGSLLLHGTRSAPSGITGAFLKVRATVDTVCRSVVFHGLNLSQNISQYTTLRGSYV